MATNDSSPSAEAAALEGRKQRAAAEGTRASRRREAAVQQGSPRWLVPTALTLLIVGLLYLVTYYITKATLPLPIGDWNLGVGLGIILVGGALLTSWK
ncbi:MAG: cell division protein CrgA [Dermabacter sp.]|nr:cell division protein CrgA [Dermabacter sp.]